MFDTPSEPLRDTTTQPESGVARIAQRDPRSDSIGDVGRPVQLVRDADLPAKPPVRWDAREVSPRTEALSRALSFGIALTALVALSPVLVLVAVTIKLTSPGPVLYAQTRVGLNRRRRTGRVVRYDRRSCDLGGRVFRIYKFRTMRIDAERRGVQWATKNDPRVTRIGRFLRQCRLDELPQLFNVLRGDMNIVGPRPERPSIVRRLAESIDEYPLRLWTKPGITGLAQINLTYDTCLDDVRAKVRYDMDYIRRQSVSEDLRIMLCTLPAMLYRRGGW